MSTIAKLNIDIIGSVEGLQTAMTEAAGIVENAGKKMSSAGKTLTAGVSAPLGAIAGLAVNASTALNENLGNVQSLGVAQEQVEAYKEAIQDMAVTVGKDTADLGDGLYQVVSAFGDGADTVEILEINAKAAAAGLASTTDAINLTSAVTKGYGDTSAEAVSKVSDLAFKTVQLGQTTFPELASSMGRVVPLGSSLGASMEELFGVMATATGVTGSAAEVSTQLRGVLQTLAAPTSEMSSLIEEWGFSSGQAALESMGLQGVIAGIVEKAEASGQPLQKYISSIEGQTLALALAGPQADVFTEKLSAMGEAGGAMEEAFKAQTEGVNASGFAMAQLRQKFQVFLQDVGDALAPTLAMFLDYLTPVVDWIAAWADYFSQLSPKIQLVVGGIVAFLVALGPTLFILGQVVTTIGSLTPLFAALGTAIGLVLSPLGLLVAGFGALVYFNIGGIRDKIVALKDGIVEAIPAMTEALGDLWTAIEWIWNGEGAEVDWWYDITNTFAAAFGIPQEAADNFASKLYEVGAKVSEYLEGIRGAWSLFTETISGTGTADSFEAAGIAISNAFGPDSARMVNEFSLGVADVIQGIKDLGASEELANLGTQIQESFGNISTLIEAAFNGEIKLETLKGFVTLELMKVKDAALEVINGEAFQGIKSGLASVFDSVGLLEPLQNMKADVQAVFTELTPYFEGPLTNLKDALLTITGLDFSPIVEGFNNLKGAFESLFGDEDADGAGARLVAGLGIGALQVAIEGIVLIVEGAVATIQGFIATIGNVMTLIGTTVEGVRDLIDAVVHGDIEGAFEALKTLVTGVTTFLDEQVAIVAELATTIRDSIFSFVGATFDDINILLGEPEWLADLIAWVPEVPTWVTDFLNWNWEQPDWLQNLFDFKLPRPDWLDSMLGLLRRLGRGGNDEDNRQLGSRYYPGGWSWVGEAGPELMYIPRGAAILPNRQSAGVGMGGVTVNVQNMTVREEADIWKLAEQIDIMRRRRS